MLRMAFAAVPASALGAVSPLCYTHASMHELHGIFRVGAQRQTARGSSQNEEALDPFSQRRLPKRVRSAPAAPATALGKSSKLGAIAALRRSSRRCLRRAVVVVVVTAIGLNYADVFCVLGLYEAANKHLGGGGGALCLGLEFAGEVRARGSQVARSRRATASPASRASARTAVVQSEKLLRKLPDGWSDAEGAALLVQGPTTQHGCIELGGAKEGSRVLARGGGRHGPRRAADLRVAGCTRASSARRQGAGRKGRSAHRRPPRASMSTARPPHESLAWRARSQAARGAAAGPFPPRGRPRRPRPPSCASASRAVRRSCAPAEPRAYAAKLAALPAFDVVVESLGGGFFHAGLDAGRLRRLPRDLWLLAAVRRRGRRGREGFKLILAYLRRRWSTPASSCPRTAASWAST